MTKGQTPEGHRLTFKSVPAPSRSIFFHSFVWQPTKHHQPGPGLLNLEPLLNHCGMSLTLPGFSFLLHPKQNWMKCPLGVLPPETLLILFSHSFHQPSSYLCAHNPSCSGQAGSLTSWDTPSMLPPPCIAMKDLPPECLPCSLLLIQACPPC